MGTTIGSIQVYLGNQDRKEVYKLVVDTLKGIILNDGFIESKNKITIARSKNDRYLSISDYEDTRWMTVFDSHGYWRETSEKLSKSINGTAVYLVLYDSNVLHIRRYTNGQIVDEYCNDPRGIRSYVDIMDPAWRPDWDIEDKVKLEEITKGDIDKWSDLFQPDVNPNDIKELLIMGPNNFDDSIWEIGNAFGMNMENLFDAGQPGAGVVHFFERR
jgi:hypothetical protein